MTERNPQAKQMADESMVRNLAAQAEAIWPQEQPVFAGYGEPNDILDVGCGTGDQLCVIGNFSGRNAGDAAILGGLLKDITRPTAPSPTTSRRSTRDSMRRQYPGYDIRPVGMLPWNLSGKILGLPIFRSVLRSDLVLLTDAILFDRQLFNPLYNYLSTMSLVLPLARSRGVPVVLYNVSLGPARTPMGKACLRRVLDAANEIILRDEESLGEIPAGGG